MLNAFLPEIFQDDITQYSSVRNPFYNSVFLVQRNNGIRTNVYSSESTPKPTYKAVFD